MRLRAEVFLAERLEFYLREVKGQAYDVVKAVLAAGLNDVRDAVARAEAVTAVAVIGGLCSSVVSVQADEEYSSSGTREG